MANVNRWRRQVGLGPVSAEVAEGMIETITVAGTEGWKVDILGNGPADSHATARLIVTAVTQNGQTWFFKIVGANSAVESQLSQYGEFVDSISS